MRMAEEPNNCDDDGGGIPNSSPGQPMRADDGARIWQDWRIVQ